MTQVLNHNFFLYFSLYPKSFNLVFNGNLIIFKIITNSAFFCVLNFCVLNLSLLAKMLAIIIDCRRISVAIALSFFFFFAFSNSYS
jgi:hypothetical protein